jgi:hypothetical protein
MAVKPENKRQHRLKRITDVQYEPRMTLMPIEGYQDGPFLPLEIAVGPLEKTNSTYSAKSFHR